MRKLSILVAAGIAQPLLTFSPVTLADTSATNTPIVVSASRLEQPVNRVGSSVVVLSGDELRERGVKYVADALLEVPSLLVTTFGPRGSQTQIRVRGNEANHVLVLIDGMRLNDAAASEFDLAQLTLEGVDKIEVLMGPQGTLYGNDAAAGVISITTVKGKEGFSGSGNNTIGSLGTRSTSALLSGGKAGWHYMVSASDFTTDGISAANEKNGNTEKDGFEHDALKLKAGYDHQSFQTWIAYNQARSRYEFDDWDGLNSRAIDSLTNNQERDTRGVTWAIAAPAMNGRLHNQIQFSNARNDYDSQTTFGPTIRRTDRNDIEYQGRYNITDHHTVQLGVDSTNESLEAGSFNRDLDLIGTYLQWLGNFGQLDATLSARSDDHEQFGRHSTHRATLSYQLNDAWRLRSAYGTGFKAPTLNELYDDSFGSNNPALKPEESKSAELGLEYHDKTYNGSVTVFQHETTNLIRWVVSRLENVNKADNKGIELTAGANWDQFDINGAVTWLDATETNSSNVEGQRLRVPDLAGNLTANYHLVNGRVWGQALYRDERLDIGSNYVAEYWLFNLGASYDVADNITLSGRIENLADKEYEELFSYGTRGRTGTVAVDWRF